MTFENLDVIFFLKKMMVVFVLNMHEVWANAPSLEHKSMGLKKTLVDHLLRTMMQVMIF